MAETEDGIYTSFLGHLYYADKDNLSNWTPFAISQIVTIPKGPLSATPEYLAVDSIYSKIGFTTVIVIPTTAEATIS